MLIYYYMNVAYEIITGRSQTCSAAGFFGGASLCSYQQTIHCNSLLLTLLEFLFIASKMPWDIWIIAALQIVTGILPSWEKIMKVKMLFFEGCYLLICALKISVLTIIFMTLAFSSDLIELILRIPFVNSLYLTISSTTYVCGLLFLSVWASKHVLAM